MTFLLDSNVISELWKPRPSEAVLEWFLQTTWLLPVPVIAEIQAGAEATINAARRQMINQRLDQFLVNHSSTILDWDAETSRTWARLSYSREVRRHVTQGDAALCPGLSHCAPMGLRRRGAARE